MEWHLISNQWAHFNVVSWEVKVVFGEVIHREAEKSRQHCRLSILIEFERSRLV